MTKLERKNVSWFLRLLPILACVALVVIIYYPVFFMGHWAINSSDALNMHLPNNYMIAEAFRQGKFPYWNPSINLGQAIADGSSRIFHPALILYVLFKPWLANTIEILLGLFFTCLGVWYLLRQQGSAIFPTIIGMLVYVLSGPVFLLHSYHMTFMAMLALPWCVLLFHKHDLTNHPRWLWLATAIIILVVHCLDYDILLYFYAGLIIDRLVCLPSHRKMAYIMTWASIFLLSGATGLVSYLPFYEWAKHSSRITKSYWGVLTPDFSNIMAAMFMNHWLKGYPYDVFYFYFGPAIIWFVLAGLVAFKRTSYALRYFLCSLIIPTLYIVKHFLQLHYLPFLASVESWRSMFVFCLGISMVSSMGVYNILHKQCFQRRLALMVVFIILMLAIWVMRYNIPIYNYSIILITASAILITVLSWSRETSIFQFIGISIAVLTSSVIPVIIRMSVRDQYRWKPAIQSAIVQNRMLIRDLESYRMLDKAFDDGEDYGRISVIPGTENLVVLAGLKIIPAYTNLYNLNFENAFCADGLIKCTNTHPFWMKLDLQINAVTSRILALYGVKFVVSLDGRGVSETGGDAGVDNWFERKDLSWEGHRVFENKSYVGRAYLVAPSGELKPGVKFLQDKREFVVLEVNTQEGERLVLTDLNYPGWHVFVDDKPVPTEVYYGCLRSVNLSKGKHIVRWEYTGRLHRLGMILSAIVLLFLACFLCVLSFFKKNKSFVI